MHRPLRAIDLLPCGPRQRLGGRVCALDEVDSTNAYLLNNAAGALDGTLAVAEFQRAGRGRRGRAWVAPRGSSVLLSVLLKELHGGPIERHATVLASVAACEAVEEATDCRPGVSWPNDLVIAGRKLGGVLAETTALERGLAVVIGIGINCLQQRGHFNGELAQRATSLEIESAGAIDRARVAAALVRRLDAWLVAVAGGSCGEARLRAAWRARCTDLGGRVTLRHDTETFTGTVIDVMDDGDLDVQLDVGGRRRFGAATTTRNG
jgi:BirA family biotin operon repressor/biotin-[acetyl-CoA-carboxylase] ligase